MSPTFENLDVDRKRLVLWLAAAAFLLGAVFVGWSYVGTFVLGVFAYYVTRPLFRRIHAHIHSRTLATTVSLLVVTVPVLVLVSWTIAIVVRELGSVLSPETIAAALGPYVDVTELTRNVDAVVAEVLKDPSVLTRGPLADQLAGLAEQFGNLAGAAAGSLGFVASVGLHLFIALVVTFFLLRDDYRIVRWYKSTFDSGPDVVWVYARAVDEDLHSIFFGNILNALLTGLLAVLTYSLLNLVAPPGLAIPQPALVGILVGVGSLVPIVGIKIVWVPIALYLLVVSVLSDPTTLWFVVVFAVVSVVVVDTIPDQVLRPFVSGRNLNVGAVMLAYTFGPLFFGWYGIFLGPLLLAVGYEFARIVVPWLVDPTRLDDIAATVDPAFAESEPEPAPPAEPPEPASSTGGPEKATDHPGETDDETGAGP